MATIEYHCPRCSTGTSDNPKPWLSSSHPLRGGRMSRPLTITCRMCGASMQFPITEDLQGELVRSAWTYRFS
jgi:hypothetical protein